jgi:tetratricopeptide (TPR) repeat protein
LFGPGQDGIIAGLFPVLLLAFSEPFWYQALIAEVYTLHSFFTCLIIYYLLRWRVKEDIRFLFAAAFFYGLSAGNHATVVFYLPAILLLFLAWEKKARTKNLLISSLIFIIGFSVYLYLPVRSLAEPTIDWGNPETVQGFLYHITDRQHANTHFEQMNAGQLNQIKAIGSGLNSWVKNTLHVLKMLFHDLNLQLTAVSVVGFGVGAILCFKANRPLFIFFMLIVALNASFFVGWQKESYFPSYIVACIWTSAFLHWVLQIIRTNKPNILQDSQNESRIENRFLLPTNMQTMVAVFLAGCVMWQISTNYYKVDRSGNYFAESLLKRMILSIDDNSIFITGISWFNTAYHQDVMRLRDDVTFVKAWDFLDSNPPSLLTPKRYPRLKLPDPEEFRFDSRQESYLYVLDFFKKNSQGRPVLVEQNYSLLKEFPLAERLAPHSNLLLRYKPQDNTSPNPGIGFEEFNQWLEEELSLPGIQNDSLWIQKVSFYIPSFAEYFHSAGYYKEERATLLLMKEFLGHGGVTWDFKMIDNLILEGRLEEARKNWEMIRQQFPGKFETNLAEGLLLSKEGKWDEALHSFKHASDINPKSFRPHFESAKTRMMLKDPESAKKDLEQARARVTSLRELNQVHKLFEPLSSL